MGSKCIRFRLLYFFLEFQVEGWRDNASADPDALRAMLKSSAKIANLL